MRPVQEVLNKILWDAREQPEQYVIGYYDRVRGTIIEVPFKDIRVEEGFMIITRCGEEAMVPLHRIRVVKKAGEVVWARSTTRNSD